MIDLFGLNREPSQEPPPQDAPPPASEAPRGSHRLWAFLLVLDSIFVIVFSGSVATKVYQYWKTPVATLTPAAARRKPAAPKPAEAPKPEPVAAAAPAPVTPKAAEAPKPAAPAKAAEPESPKPTAKTAEAPRPPKPSLLTETPKPRPTPAPAAAAAAAESGAAGGPVVAPAAPGKAQPVVFKYRGEGKSVQLVGAFIVHGGRKEMTKGADGVWTIKVYLNRGQFRYFFAVDKKKVLDPENPRSDRGASLLTIP